MGINGMQLSEREGLELWRRAVTASVRSDAPDLTARQQAILMTIALTPGPHTVRGLAEQLNIAKPAVTRALDALERLDFIKRVRDEADLRNIFLERRPAGMTYLRQFAGLVLAAASGKDPETAAPKTRKATAA
jgi:DNA-binding MarR family transcriptional regulator